MFPPETTGQADLGLKMMNILFFSSDARSDLSQPVDQEAKPVVFLTFSWLEVGSSHDLTSVSQQSLRVQREVTKTTCLEGRWSQAVPGRYE